MRWLSPTSTRLALVMEMHLVLGPVSLFILLMAMPALLLGFPHGLGFVADPISRQDARMLALMAAIPPAAFALWTFWDLGVSTITRMRFGFGWSFGLALLCSLAGAALAAEVYGARAWQALVPIWVFVLHMVLLQWRLRRRR